MASATLAPSHRSASVEFTNDSILLRNISWELYETLRAEESNWRVRMNYCDGDLELMSPSQQHEKFGRRFDSLLLFLARILSFKILMMGSTTWKRPETAKAKEADACFYIANFARIQNKVEIDLEVDPPPDLAIEVEMSRSAIKAMSIYAALGVPEVWRFDGERLAIEIRQESGDYVESDRSLAFPFLTAAEIQDWIRKSAELNDDVEWTNQLEAWIRAVLIPRRDQL